MDIYDEIESQINYIDIDDIGTDRIYTCLSFFIATLLHDSSSIANNDSLTRWESSSWRLLGRRWEVGRAASTVGLSGAN